MKKSIIVAGLAAVIIFVFGKVGYHFLNPVEAMMTRGEQATFEATMSADRCRGMVTDYEENKVDGYISYDYGLPKMKRCQAAIMAQYEFYITLEAFMTNAYNRAGLLNTEEEE